MEGNLKKWGGARVCIYNDSKVLILLQKGIKRNGGITTIGIDTDKVTDWMYDLHVSVPPLAIIPIAYKHNTEIKFILKQWYSLMQHVVWQHKLKIYRLSWNYFIVSYN